MKKDDKDRFVGMPYLKLKLISGNTIGQKNSCSFTEFGGSIGRAEECDWALQDVDRVISKKHAVLSFNNQQFTVTDVSSNGLIINNAAAPLGKNNQYVLQMADIITIGKYVIQVEDINLQRQPDNSADNHNTQPTDSDLFSLVMGRSEVPTKTGTEHFFNSTPDINNSDTPEPESGLGLQEILSSPVRSLNASNQAKPVVQDNPFKTANAEQNPFISDGLNAGNKSPFDSDSLIPDDWDLSDMTPVVNEYKSADALISMDKSQDNPAVNLDSELPDSPFFNTDAPSAPLQKAADNDPSPSLNFPQSKPSADTDIAAGKLSPSPTSEPVLPVTASAAVNQAKDDFFTLLYNKLGLPKEYLGSIDKEAFADDIVTILLSTTKGLMALLSSRTAFKQESRLSSTLIQPRSNNPIKFSIDPVDTLEMLLLKKKKGYMSTQASYDEAMEDIQLHQMAFLSGLQATLVGVVNQLDPEAIEKQVNDKGKRLMGLNSSSQYWQLYKEKQQSLSKTVKENLNEVLGSYFSEAYQAQINSFKNDK